MVFGIWLKWRRRWLLRCFAKGFTVKENVLVRLVMWSSVLPHLEWESCSDMSLLCIDSDTTHLRDLLGCFTSCCSYARRAETNPSVLFWFVGLIHEYVCTNRSQSIIATVMLVLDQNHHFTWNQWNHFFLLGSMCGSSITNRTIKVSRSYAVM